MPTLLDLASFIGRSPDGLSLSERALLRGKWIALQLYSPSNLALRRIEAVGASPADCVAALRARNLEPANYEFVLHKGD